MEGRQCLEGGSPSARSQERGSGAADYAELSVQILKHLFEVSSVAQEPSGENRDDAANAAGGVPSFLHQMAYGSSVAVEDTQESAQGLAALADVLHAVACLSGENILNGCSGRGETQTSRVLLSLLGGPETLGQSSGLSQCPMSLQTVDSSAEDQESAMVGMTQISGCVCGSESVNTAENRRSPSAVESHEIAHMYGGKWESEAAGGVCVAGRTRNLAAEFVSTSGVSSGSAETLDKHAGPKSQADNEDAKGCSLDLRTGKVPGIEGEGPKPLHLPRSIVAVARHSDESRTPDACRSPVGTPQTLSSLPTSTSLGGSPPVDSTTAIKGANASSPNSSSSQATSVASSPLSRGQSGASPWYFYPRREVPKVVPDVGLFSSVRRLQRRSLMKLTGSDEGAYGENCCASLLVLFRLLQERYGLSPMSVFLDIGSGSGIPSFLAATTVGCVTSLGVEMDTNVYAIACNNHLKLLDQRLVASLSTQDFLRRTREAPKNEQKDPPAPVGSSRNQGVRNGGDGGSFLAPLNGVVAPWLQNCLRDHTTVTEEDLTFSVANVSTGLDLEANSGEVVEKVPSERRGVEKELGSLSHGSSSKGSEGDRVSGSLFALTSTGLAYPCNVAFKCADASRFASFDGVSHIFSFDLAMPPRVLVRLCSLFNRSLSPVVYVSFHANLVSAYGLEARLVQRLRMRMAGSAESHMAFIYVRKNCLSLSRFNDEGGESVGPATSSMPSGKNGSLSDSSQACLAEYVCDLEVTNSVPRLPSVCDALRSGGVENGATEEEADGRDFFGVTKSKKEKIWMNVEKTSLARALLLRGMVHSRTENFFSHCILAGVLPRVVYTLLHAVALLCTESPLNFEAPEDCEALPEQGFQGSTARGTARGETVETGIMKETDPFFQSKLSFLPALHCCRKCCSEIFLSNLSNPEEPGAYPRRKVATTPSIGGFSLPVAPLSQQQLLLLRRLVAVFGLDQLLETGALSSEGFVDLLLLRPASACRCQSTPCASRPSCATRASEDTRQRSGEAERVPDASLRSASSFVCAHGIRRLARFLGKVILQMRLAREGRGEEAHALGLEVVETDPLRTITLLEVRVCRKWESQRRNGVGTDPVSLDAWNAESQPRSGARRSARPRREVVAFSGTVGEGGRSGAVTKKPSRKVSRIEVLTRKTPGTKAAKGRGNLGMVKAHRSRPHPRRSSGFVLKGSQRRERGAPAQKQKKVARSRNGKGEGGVWATKKSQQCGEEQLRGEEILQAPEQKGNAPLCKHWVRFFIRTSIDLSVPDHPEANSLMDRETKAGVMGENADGVVGVVEIPCLSPLCHTCSSRTFLPQLLEANAPPAVQQLKIQSEILRLQTTPLIQLADKEGQAAWEAELSREAEAFFLLDEREDEAESDEVEGQGMACKGTACAKRREPVADRLKREDGRGPARVTGCLDETALPNLSDTSGASQVVDLEEWRINQSRRSRRRCAHVIRATIRERLNAVLSPGDLSSLSAPLLFHETNEELSNGSWVKQEAVVEEDLRYQRLEAELCRRIEGKEQLCDLSSTSLSPPHEGICFPVRFMGSPVPPDSLHFAWDFSKRADPSVPPSFLSKGTMKSPGKFCEGDIVPLLWPVRVAEKNAVGEKQKIACWNAQLLRVQWKTRRTGSDQRPQGVPVSSHQEERLEKGKGEKRVRSEEAGDFCACCNGDQAVQSPETNRSLLKGAQQLVEEANIGIGCFDGGLSAVRGWTTEEELDWEIAPGLCSSECHWETRSFPVAAYGDPEVCYQEARGWLLAQLTTQETAVLRLLRCLNRPLLRLSRHAAVNCFQLDPCVLQEEVEVLHRTVAEEAEELQRLWIHARFLEFALLQEVVLVEERLEAHTASHAPSKRRLEARNEALEVHFKCFLKRQILRLQQLQMLRELGDRDTSEARALVLLRQLKDETQPLELLRLPASSATGSFPIQEVDAPFFCAREESGAREAGDEEEAGGGLPSLWQASADGVRETVLSLVASLFRGKRPTLRVEALVESALRLFDLLCMWTKGSSREKVETCTVRRGRQADCFAWLPEGVVEFLTSKERRQTRDASELEVLCNFLRCKLEEFRTQLWRETEEEQRALLQWLQKRERKTEAAWQLTSWNRDETSGGWTPGERNAGSESQKGVEIKLASDSESDEALGKIGSAGRCSSPESSSKETGGYEKVASENGCFPFLKGNFAFTLFATAGAKGVPEAFACLKSLPEHMEALMRDPLSSFGPPHSQSGAVEGAQTVDICPLWRSYFFHLGLIHTAKELLFRRSLLDAGDMLAAPPERRGSLAEDTEISVVSRHPCGADLRVDAEEGGDVAVAYPGKGEEKEILHASDITATVEEADRYKAIDSVHKRRRERNEEDLLASPRAPKKRRSAEPPAN
ncbi:histone methylation protein DOT1 [Toxoplasma gondii GAB2-2007-GAL-DOM2]|uniref:DOT1 domain-containing protein n=5 Tax=Toxoplasma gondii TaxID=5811 RepID=S7UNS4_TOXGG|nr:hypothetical protein TGGT1_210310 [Toxoplasma gondii GT1]KAF4644652.1 hypothetical protein TGRH88_016460 [Toxoplasma gondii]KFG29616.1 histone methylation protein DOT1 [Toxoplasma gondii GAB2-2007-GAL-DOM2]KFG33328.1 histone methylation protein DOT1 [Toxoplasma gondii FOU]RQX73504.1 histone methylation protein DOT1 [Toxoplasma gondii CAST]